MASKGCCGDSQPWEAGPASIQKVMRNGVKPHALKEGGWGFYEAAECFGKAKSFDKHDAMSFWDGG